MQPLGHRLLIKPDLPETQTASGLVLPDDRDHIPVSGVVVTVGDGLARDQRVRRAVLLRAIGIIEELAGMGVRDPQDYMDEIRRYMNSIERIDGPCHVGDRVAYPVDAGLRIEKDGEAFILLNEDDIAVIVPEDAEEKAA